MIDVYKRQLLLKLDGISNWELLKTIILPNISVVYTQEISRAFVVAILDLSLIHILKPVSHLSEHHLAMGNRVVLRL